MDILKASKLEGTEKQVKYANDIIEVALERAKKANAERVIEHLTTTNSAGEIINLYKDLLVKDWNENRKSLILYEVELNLAIAEKEKELGRELKRSEIHQIKDVLRGYLTEEFLDMAR